VVEARDTGRVGVPPTARSMPSHKLHTSGASVALRGEVLGTCQLERMMIKHPHCLCDSCWLGVGAPPVDPALL
jgi:hypothetical protein